MLVRTIGFGAVLAVAAAFVAHAAVFGMSHAAGGAHAFAFDAILAAALGLVVTSAFLRSALAPARARGALGYRLAVPLAVGPGAFAAYALIECSEGRAPLAGGIAVIFGCALGALVAVLGAHALASLAARSGAALAALAVSPASRVRAARLRALAFEIRCARSALVEGRRLGRAPPRAR